MKDLLRGSLEHLGILKPHPSRVRAPAGTPAFDFSAMPGHPNAPALYAAARARGPVCFDTSERCWVVLSHPHVVRALKQPDAFSNEYTSQFDPFLAASDGAAHNRFRHTLAAAIGSQTADSIASWAKAWSEEFVGQARQTGSFDAVSDLGVPLPRAFTIRLLGLTDAERDRVVAELKPRRTDMNGALEGVGRVLRDVLQAAAREPREGVISALVNAPPESRLPDEQITVLARHLWFAGTTTLSLLLPAAVATLCRSPSVAERLRQEPDLVPVFVSEMLRLESPLQFVRRKCMHNMEFASMPFKKGALVKLCLASANRDPAAFPDPDEIRWDRTVHRHLAFGLGDHFCMGAIVARTMAGIAVTELVNEFRTFSDAGNRGHPQYESSETFRGLLPFRVAVV